MISSILLNYPQDWAIAVVARCVVDNMLNNHQTTQLYYKSYNGWHLIEIIQMFATGYYIIWKWFFLHKIMEYVNGETLHFFKDLFVGE